MVAYVAQKIWNIIPLEMRNLSILTEFTTNIKFWIPKNCPCTFILSVIETKFNYWHLFLKGVNSPILSRYSPLLKSM